MTALERNIAKAATWLREQAEQTDYGSVGVTLVLHGGCIVRVERLVIDKEATDGGPGHERNAGAGSRSSNARAQRAVHQGSKLEF